MTALTTYVTVGNNSTFSSDGSVTHFRLLPHYWVVGSDAV